MEEGDFIFHYTNANALIEIVTKRTIWATQPMYMNDKREGVIAKNHLSMLVNAAVHADSSDINKYSQKVIKELAGCRKSTYVTSFTARSDNLSLYRTYCPPDGGYCIGFEKTKIAGIKDTKLIKCDYSDQYTSKKVTDLYNELIIEIKKYFDQGIDDNNAFKKLKKTKYFNDLMNFSDDLKFEAFNTEEEYRLVTTSSEIPKLRASSRNNVIVPYIEVELPKEMNVMITLGSNTNIDIAEDSFQILRQFSKEGGRDWGFITKVGGYSEYRNL